MNNNERMRQVQQDEIDLLELFHVLMGKIWAIILCAVIGVVIAGTYTKLMITPQYAATSTIYVLSNTTSITSVADLQLGTQLTADYQLIAKSRTVVNEVIEESGMDLTYEGLLSHLTVENPAETHMLKVTVTDPDPASAAELSNIFAKVLTEQVAEVMNTDKPNIAERAVKPAKPVSPNFMKNIMMGGMIGVVLCCAWIVIRYLMNDTIQTEEDVNKYLGVNTLAVIPLEKRRA